jgi:hypothetical protein
MTSKNHLSSVEPAGGGGTDYKKRLVEDLPCTLEL